MDSGAPEHAGSKTHRTGDYAHPMGTRPMVVGAITIIFVGSGATSYSTATTARMLPSTSVRSACRQLYQQQLEQAPAGGYAYFYDTSGLENALQSSGSELLRGVSSETASASKSNSTKRLNAALEAGRAACRLAILQRLTGTGNLFRISGRGSRSPPEGTLDW